MNITNKWLFPHEKCENEPRLCYDINAAPRSLLVDFTDGRRVWIEQIDGTIKVHCYDSDNDEPVTVRLSLTDAVVDARDRGSIGHELSL